MSEAHNIMDTVVLGWVTTPHHHTKHNFPFWLVQPPEKLPRETFRAYLTIARDLGGWYSRKFGNTPGGYAFREEKHAVEFVSKITSDPPSPDSPTLGSSSAARFERLACVMQATIDAKRAPLTQNPTPRRLGIKQNQLRDANQLEAVQRALRALACALEAGTLREPLTSLPVSRAAIARLMNPYEKRNKTQAAQREALLVLLEGSISPEDREQDRARRDAEDRRKRLDPLRWSNIPGFFPTPPHVVERIVELAELGDRKLAILEPSAGIGSLAAPFRDHVRKHGGGIVCIEYNYSLGEVLGDEGYGVEAGTELIIGDCLDPETVKRATTIQGESFEFDLIVMNPPFEKKQDIKHVVAMMKLLAPGGRLISVVSSVAGDEAKKGSDGGFGPDYYVESLPEKSFTGPKSFRTTSVNAKLLVYDKPRR